MPSDKLTDEEKAKLQEAFKDAAVSDSDIQTYAMGVDESGDVVMPVDDETDLISAAAGALEFVDSLEAPEPKVDTVATDDDAVAGFDALLGKLERLRADISALQRGVVGVFASQLLTFRGKVVELKTAISEEMVDRLRMKFFKSFIESTFVDIVDTEFAALEKDLVDKIVEQTQDRFKEFAARVRESELDLRSTIVDQQDVIRSFMQTLEADADAQAQHLSESETQVSKLERQIRELQGQVDAAKSADVSREEYQRMMDDYESQISELKEDLVKGSAVLDKRTKELDESRSKADDLRTQLAEARSQAEVYKTELETAKKGPSVSSAEVEALESKVDLLEESLSEKRKEADSLDAKVKSLTVERDDAIKQRDLAEVDAKKHLKELDTMQDKIREVKNLEERIYELENELTEANEQIDIIKMQSEAYEKATRLMEKERDIALQARDISEERTKRYIHVMSMEANTKALILVDEVGSITIKELAESLGKPKGLVERYARDLEKLGVLKIKGKKAISTLEDLKLEEGEVKVD